MLKKETERGKQQGEHRGAWWEDRSGAGWTCDATNYVYKNNFYNTIYKNTTIIIIITVILINITIFFKAQFCHLYLTLSSADQIQKNIF